ncbi:tripeptide aminopeptidase [Muriicola jejuensis]|uniref:Peptidase T n=1 Tax=Muriicola jejuensis TaxID=504488 RepID=A0A6P0UBQ5_9FLAO|nr:peptidase T [Muriicola jejuensis]NER10721.1 peptidase T [Muriicola jejuensis]SMP16588.1 tripeptide aminopeptidase [Muriicola jejuensis]
MKSLLDRFLSYVRVDTQSDPKSDSTPSTDKQWVLAKQLFEELKDIGLVEVTMDEKGYIMATLPANLEKEVPVIGFVSHYDTSPDFTATGVNPRIIKDYDGKDIVLNSEKNIVLSPDYFEDLLLYKGQDLIVTDGTTLLGADDKAGVAEIVTAMEYLIAHPEIRHGKVRIGFTPDEEIGRGAHHFDVEQFGAEWAYTMDGSQIGELEYENFNAARAKITARGKSVHPGYAKDKMVNAIGIITEFASRLPGEEVPEKTSGREGFFHIHHLEGSIESASLEMIIRDHDRARFEDRKRFLELIVAELNQKYPNALDIEMKDQYYNMREKVEPVYHIVEIAKEAMEQLGIAPIIKPIRGGTDGSQLSFKGLPCPNIFAGGHNFHGKYEYVPIQSMEKAVEVIIRICELTAGKS